MGEWQVGWARRDSGRIAQVTAPGHSRPRCCYVDFLNTGPAVAATLRRQISRIDAIRRVSNLTVTDLVTDDGAVTGAVALDTASGEPVTIAARATIIATGGLTRIYRRNSASANMGGDGYALALLAGAPLVDMEFVQFFPIGHLAPRLVGMDPIMWDPFRYKLGGRLLDGAGREFLARYGSDETDAYTTPRDIASYAITKEVAAGRGSPHGGVVSVVRACAARLRCTRRSGRLSNGWRRTGSISPAPRSRCRRSRITTWAASSWTIAWRARCPGCSRPARRSAAPTAPTGCPATRSPKPWSFGERAGRSAAARAGRHRRLAARRLRRRRSSASARLRDGRQGDVGAADTARRAARR